MLRVGTESPLYMVVNLYSTQKYGASGIVIRENGKIDNTMWHQIATKFCAGRIYVCRKIG